MLCGTGSATGLMGFIFIRSPKSHRTQQASVRGICRGGLVGSALQAQSFDQDFTVKVHGRPHILQWAVDANHAAAAFAGPAPPSILNTCRSLLHHQPSSGHLASELEQNTMRP